jgi:hypothetical protein
MVRKNNRGLPGVPKSRLHRERVAAGVRAYHARAKAALAQVNSECAR